MNLENSTDLTTENYNDTTDYEDETTEFYTTEEWTTESGDNVTDSGQTRGPTEEQTEDTTILVSTGRMLDTNGNVCVRIIVCVSLLRVT